MTLRAWCRLAAAAVVFHVTLLVGAVTAPTAEAHASYVRSEPPSGGKLAAPGTITAYFTEEPDPDYSELQVLDATLRRVDRRDTRAIAADARALTVSVPDLPDGTYTVAWRTLSRVDGHTIKGAFPLVVGEGDSAGVAQVFEVRPDPVESGLRAITFLGSLLLFGAYVFRAIVLGAQEVPPEATRAGLELERAWERRFRWFGLGIIGVMLVAQVWWFGLQVAQVSDVTLWAAFGEPMARLIGTRTGTIWALKGVALFLLAASLFGPRRLLVPAGLALAGAFMFGTSLTSHAAALERGREVATAVDWLHQVGAAAWLGCLAGALLLFPDVLRAGPLDRPGILRTVAPRLSNVAAGGVALIAVTGLFGALVQVGSVEAMRTIYGSALAIKLLILIPMLLLGAVNRFLFVPRLARAEQGEEAHPIAGRSSPEGRRDLAARSSREPTGDPGLVRLAQGFRSVIGAEVALGLVILGSTGVLTSVEPGREVWGREPKTIEVTGSADDLAVRLRIEPGRVGENTFTVSVRDRSGAPAAGVQRVQLRFSYVDQGFGRGVRTLESAEPGVYRIVANDLSVAGRWQVEVAVRRLDREDSVAAFLIDVGVPTAPNGGSAIALPRLSTAYAPYVLGLLALGVLALGRGVLLPSRRRQARVGLIVGSAATILVSGLALLPALDFKPDVLSLRSPIPMTRASIERGQDIYTNSGCISCHGISGRGDGPLAPTLRPRPADFRVHMAAGHSDGQLFDWVTNGVEGTAMPAYAGAIDETDRWHVINYIRGFAGE